MTADNYVDSSSIKSSIIKKASEIGFDVVGFSTASPDSRAVKAFEDWLSKNYECEMDYMRRTAPREDPANVLSGAKTIITLAINYYHEQEPLRRGNGRIARYAFGRDYHKVIEKKLKLLKAGILAIYEDVGIKGYVDTGPLLERSFAVQSGLGKIGKNGCLFTKEYGSWVLLAELITTLDIPPDPVVGEAPFSICGDCDLCIKACPTGAIVEPGVIDARKCISYQTIENKGDIPKDVADLVGRTRRIFGCDICQEVCPVNKVAKQTEEPDFIQKKAGDQIPLKDILAIPDDEAFLELFAGSSVMRAKRRGLQRNAKLCL